MIPKGWKVNTDGNNDGMRAKEVHLDDNFGWPELWDDYSDVDNGDQDHGGGDNNHNVDNNHGSDDDSDVDEAVKVQNGVTEQWWWFDGDDEDGEVQPGGNVSYWVPRAGEVGGVQGGEQPRCVFFCFVFAYFSFFVFTHTKILSVLSRNACSGEKLTSDFCKKNAANWKNVFST